MSTDAQSPVSAPVYPGLFGQPWAITEAGALEFAIAFASNRAHALGKSNATDDDDDDDIKDLFGSVTLGTTMQGNVAVIRVSGVLISNADWLDRLLGGVAQQDIVAAVDKAVAKGATAIVLDWNSPGGSVSGTPECASAISELAEEIPIYSYCESGGCASAAYWIGSCASAGFYATPSAMIGSIGCILQTTSFADALKAAGIDIQVFTSSPLKATGHPATKMSPAGATYLQASVDEIGGDFMLAVQQNRPQARDDAFDGRMFTAKQALAMGLIDGVVDDLSAVVAMATRSRGASSGRTPARAEVTQSFPRAEIEEKHGADPDLELAALAAFNIEARAGGSEAWTSFCVSTRSKGAMHCVSAVKAILASNPFPAGSLPHQKIIHLRGLMTTHLAPEVAKLAPAQPSAQNLAETHLPGSLEAYQADPQLRAEFPTYASYQAYSARTGGRVVAHRIRLEREAKQPRMVNGEWTLGKIGAREQEWLNSVKLQAEFPTPESYAAFCRRYGTPK